MEDIKVEELVRTKKGKIEKVKTVNRYEIVTKHNNDNDDISEGINYYAESGLEINKADITKHSFNIIDLLKVGDIVFIQDVLNNDFVYIYDDEMLKAVRETIEEGLEITEVLTHELYEANAYKVKGE